MDLDTNIEPSKDSGIEETTWMFKVTRYPNGKTFMSKPWQVGVAKKGFAKQKNKKQREAQIQNLEEY